MQPEPLFGIETHITLGRCGESWCFLSGQPPGQPVSEMSTGRLEDKFVFPLAIGSMRPDNGGAGTKGENRQSDTRAGGRPKNSQKPFTCDTFWSLRIPITLFSLRRPAIVCPEPPFEIQRVAMAGADITNRLSRKGLSRGR